MVAHGAPVDGRLEGVLGRWKSEGKSVVLLAVSPMAQATSGDGFAVVAAFAVTDPLRPEAADVLARLQADGLAMWMISGDDATTAKAVARAAGIPETNVIAEVLPHEKVRSHRDVWCH